MIHGGLVSYIFSKSTSKINVHYINCTAKEYNISFFEHIYYGPTVTGDINEGDNTNMKRKREREAKQIKRKQSKQLQFNIVLIKQ